MNYFHRNWLNKAEKRKPMMNLAELKWLTLGG